MLPPPAWPPGLPAPVPSLEVPGFLPVFAVVLAGVAPVSSSPPPSSSEAEGFGFGEGLFFALGFGEARGVGFLFGFAVGEGFGFGLGFGEGFGVGFGVAFGVGVGAGVGVAGGEAPGRTISLGAGLCMDGDSMGVGSGVSSLRACSGALAAAAAAAPPSSIHITSSRLCGSRFSNRKNKATAKRCAPATRS